MKKLTLLIAVAVVLVIVAASFALAANEAICHGKLVNGNFSKPYPPVVHAYGYIVQNHSFHCYTDANGNFWVLGISTPGYYEVQFDDWTGPIGFHYSGSGSGTDLGTIVGVSR